MKFRTFFDNILTNRKLVTIFTAFTPDAASDRSPLVRTTLAVGTIAVFGVALAAAATSLALLLVAVGIVYYVMTQILGVRLELDPQVLLRQAMQAQRPSSAPN